MSSFAGQIIREMHFVQHLQDLDKKCTQASKINADVCQRCGFCCHRAPGALIPEDVPVLASHLQMDVMTLFRKCLTVQSYGYGSNRKFVIMPIRHGQDFEAGRYLSDRGSWDIGPCMFLDKTTNLCTIHDTALPFDCRIGIACVHVPTDEDEKKYWTAELIEATFGFNAAENWE